MQVLKGKQHDNTSLPIAIPDQYPHVAHGIVPETGPNRHACQSFGLSKTYCNDIFDGLKIEVYQNRLLFSPYTFNYSGIDVQSERLAFHLIRFSISMCHL
jgi:hypothetical protein